MRIKLRTALAPANCFAREIRWGGGLLFKRHSQGFTSVKKRLNFSSNPRKLSMFYRSFSNRSEAQDIQLPGSKYKNSLERLGNLSKSSLISINHHQYPSKFTCDPATGWPALSCPLPFHENYACGTTTWTFFSVCRGIERDDMHIYM